MLVTLKIIHFLALAIGIGSGAANGVIGARMAKLDDAARPALAGVESTLGKMSFGALILLWLSGGVLAFDHYTSWQAVPAVFWLKIAFVVVLTGISVRLNVVSAKARGAGRLPPTRAMARLGQLAMLSSVLIVTFAALAFTA